MKICLKLFILIIFSCFVSSFAAIRRIGASISCYTCSSRNNSDSYCADPFHPAMSKYIENCKVPKQNHIGVFPARFCVKVIGKTVTTGEELVIRACSLENMDNQCGNFKFEKDTLKGCILTCDYDGCNGSTNLMNLNNNRVYLLLFIIIIMIC